MSALTDQVALELGQRGKEVKNQTPSRRRGVDVLLETLQTHAGILQLLDQVDQVLDRAAKPVQPPDHHRVAPP